MMILIRKLSESENKKSDLEIKLDHQLREIKELKAQIPTHNDVDTIYSKSVELNNLLKQLEGKKEEMERYKMDMDR